MKKIVSICIFSNLFCYTYLFWIMHPTAQLGVLSKRELVSLSFFSTTINFMCVFIFFSVKMTYLYIKRKQSIYILCPLQNHTHPKNKIKLQKNNKENRNFLPSEKTTWICEKQNLVVRRYLLDWMALFLRKLM